MKKGIIVLLIAVLVSGFAFAKFSGSAGVRVDAALGDQTILLMTNPTSFDFSFEFASEKIEIAGDEDVHVEVAASAKFILGELNPDVGAHENGSYIFTSDLSDRGIGAVISLDTAKIVGKNWYVSVLGTQKTYDYAKAAVLTVAKAKSDDFGNDKEETDDKPASYKVDYNNLPGVTVGFNGFTASAGFDFVKSGSDGIFVVSGSVETPEFAFNDDAVKVQAAAEFSRYAVKITEEQVDAKDSVIGASAKATVAIQDITVGAAVDMGLEYIGAEVAGQAGKDTEFNIDGRVDFKYNFVDVNVYTYYGKAGLKYGDGAKYQDFYLEAKAAFDLNAFELPLKVTVSAKNITNSKVADVAAGIDPSVKVEYAKDAITAAVSFGMNTESKDWNVLGYGTYAFEKFTAGAGVKVAKDEADELNVISFGCFAESDKLVKGATFGLSYGLDNDKCYSDGSAAALSGGKFSSNYKDDPATAGTMLAYCKIAF